MRQGASLPWSGVRSASAMMSRKVAASGPGATMSRAFPERRVARWARSEELSLNMVRHVGFSAPARKCCEPFATDFGPDERSEEHTSELQSLMRTSYAVFCLKQNNKTRDQKRITSNII